MKIMNNGEEELDTELESNINTETARSENKQSSKKNRVNDLSSSRELNSVQILILHIIIIVAIIWAMFGLVLGAKYAPNNDMSPNIHSGDLLFYYRLGQDYKAQDVIILKKNNTEYVGRIIAVSGDSVEITEDEELIINGNKVNETNIYATTPRFEGFTDYPLTLSDGQYFILADSRAGAEDSRYYGIISTSDIMGEVILIIRRNNL